MNTASSVQSRLERINRKRCLLCRERDKICKVIDSSPNFNTRLKRKIKDDYGEQIAYCDLEINYFNRQELERMDKDA